MLRLGLNPYGLAYTVGLQGLGTPRVNPNPIGLAGFVALTREIGCRVIELDWRWLQSLDDDALGRVRQRVDGLECVYSYWLAQRQDDGLADAIRCAAAIGARLLRIHLTPVLEGGRAQWGRQWLEMVAHGKRVLARDAARAADAGLTLAIENHQDFGSEELLELVHALGDHVGIVLDTGNPFAVGEDPVAFVTRAADRIRHVHLKDYVAQFTDEGYRLVRCAIGDGAVPFTEIVDVLSSVRRGTTLTASLEPGALESRHIRVFTDSWWAGYPPRSARELGVMLGRLRAHRLADDEDCRTPWERGEDPAVIVDYERTQLLRSLDNLRQPGWRLASA
jgi:3-oxoisoapionate decarboxylase